MIHPQQAHTALYRGVYYRSRLEACWAAFFDRHGIVFEYEERWFDFGKGNRYQPDFWLPDSQAWFEVKGRLNEADKTKILSLARAAAFRGELVIMGGAPAGYVFGEVDQRGQWNLNCSFGRCAHCDTWTVAMFGCRACGYAEPNPSRQTYIDYHDSFGYAGCRSRCDGVFVWKGNAPEILRLTSDDTLCQVQQWGADSVAALDGFKLVPKRY